MTGGCTVATESQHSQTGSDQMKWNPPANFALIVGILSLVSALVFAYLMFSNASVGQSSILLFIGVPGLSLIALLAGVIGLHVSNVSGLGHTKALAGSVIGFVGFLVFAVTSIIGFLMVA